MQDKRAERRGRIFIIVLVVLFGGAFLYDYINEPQKWHGIIIGILIMAVIALWDDNKKKREEIERLWEENIELSKKIKNRGIKK